MQLPDGSVHDGLWRAEDIGGAIKKDRIDLFIGLSAHKTFLSKVGITHLKPLKVTLVRNKSNDSCVDREPEN